ncbi:MAG: OmpA family protein [Candidatus Binataceae bacterium]
MGADALFDFDRSDLRADAQETLEALGPIINKYKNDPTEVDGYTDAIGSAEYNQRLSEQRAKTVKSWLVDHDYLLRHRLRATERHARSRRTQIRTAPTIQLAARKTAAWKL